MAMSDIVLLVTALLVSTVSLRELFAVYRRYGAGGVQCNNSTRDVGCSEGADTATANVATERPQPFSQTPKKTSSLRQSILESLSDWDAESDQELFDQVLKTCEKLNSADNGESIDYAILLLVLLLVRGRMNPSARSSYKFMFTFLCEQVERTEIAAKIDGLRISNTAWEETLDKLDELKELADGTFWFPLKPFGKSCYDNSVLEDCASPSDNAPFDNACDMNGNEATFNYSVY